MDTTYKVVDGAGKVTIFPRFSAGVHGWSIHMFIDGGEPIPVSFDSGLPVFVSRYNDALPEADKCVEMLELLAKARKEN